MVFGISLGLGVRSVEAVRKGEKTLVILKIKTWTLDNSRNQKQKNVYNLNTCFAGTWKNKTLKRASGKIAGGSASYTNDPRIVPYVIDVFF